MPVYSFRVLSATSYCLIWKIEEALEVLYARLHPLLKTDLCGFNLSSNNKMQQSLAVRVALECLLKKLGLPILTLTKNEQGKPIFKNSKTHISFSHTRNLAVVALSTRFPIGVDIEIVGSKLDVVQKRILNEEEFRHAHHCLEKLAIYWCAKEALYKLLDRQQFSTSNLLFKNIFIEPFQLQAEGAVIAHLNQKQYALGYKRIESDLGVLPHFLLFCEDHL